MVALASILGVDPFVQNAHFSEKRGKNDRHDPDFRANRA